jgi:hypothetical protein
MPMTSITSTSDSADQRRFHRVDFGGKAYLNCGEGEREVDLVDLSLHGLLLMMPEAVVLSHQEPCIVRVPLAEDLSIEMRARVVHREGRHVGMECETLDIESAQHLRRLVELNLGNEDLLHRDLAALFATRE